MIKLSNPRLHAAFTDWPLGGNKRGTCVFHVEHKPGKGYRFTRVTTGKPKCSTYGRESAIVDGDDGRTYLIQRVNGFSFISVQRSDFMSANLGEGANGAIFPESNPELFAELNALITQANSQPNQ